MESGARYSRGAREKNASARAVLAAAAREGPSRVEERNGRAIRMRDVPAKVSFRLGLTDRPAKASQENEFRAVRKPPSSPLPLNCAFNCFDYRARSYRSCPSLAVTHDPP